ncbi:MAG: type II toxin-antitoxin system mRNA interferase toxin, RelE/StbE family [bacterium]|nr:type II toxin-antitoxin system mRNA interferase toxin, RelE/StbE family [bacterium]
MEVLYSPKFVRQYKKLPREIQELAAKREDIFRVNPFDSRLKTHKLTGRLKEFSAFWIDYHIRIMFDFAEDSKGKYARFYQIGPHDIYD